MQPASLANQRWVRRRAHRPHSHVTLIAKMKAGWGCSLAYLINGLLGRASVSQRGVGFADEPKELHHPELHLAAPAAHKESLDPGLVTPAGSQARPWPRACQGGRCPEQALGTAAAKTHAPSLPTQGGQGAC